MQLRTGKLSEKQQLQLDLAEVYDKAKSSNKFIELLKQKGHQIYQRNGKDVGIKSKRKYRFKTLGYPMEKLQLLDKNIIRNQRLSQVRKLRNNRSKDSDRER
ncbi:hypothetical protein [uncultured Winogradskyella sp.]|uniref:hypothetical protein n=1 Tax=uncultured Winogradskyella sp. TaxID=395353 RepID=UPI0026043B85|nr:hypothetical protein [uncultured Winogradskyella sp.]